MIDSLTYREKEILKYIVENFVKLASPVGSRSVSKQSDLNLSSATIRNIMSDLEDMDLLKTPHISAGRIPTDKGYRFYVDVLMGHDNLTEAEKIVVKKKLEELKKTTPESDDLYIETSRLLGKITHQLAIVSQPFLKSGILEKLQLVQISSNKLLVVINIKSGYVKTVVLELDSEVSASKISKLNNVLNEKLSGLTLKEIRESFSERLKDTLSKDAELVQLFINSIDTLYSEEDSGSKLFIGGTGDVILQPEFDDPNNFRNIVKLVEDKNLVLHIFENIDPEKINITIGKENDEILFEDYSIICSNYKIGDIRGNIGILGPKRMNYSKMVSLIDYTSKLLSELFNKS